MRWRRTVAENTLKSQKEIVSLADYSTDMVNMSHQLPRHLFMVLGLLLVPIKRSLLLTFGNILLESGTSMANTVTQLLKNCTSVCENNKMSLFVKAELYYFIGDYGLAKDELVKVFGMPLQSLTGSQFMSRCQSMSVDDKLSKKYVQLCCYILYNTRHYGAAKSYFDVLTKIKSEDALFWKLLSAHCMVEVADEQTAMCLVKEVRINRHINFTGSVVQLTNI